MLSCAVVVLVLVLFVLWTILATTSHRDTVDDLFRQLTSSMDTLLEASLASSQKMVKQAHHIWQLTGSTTTTLAPLSIWATELIQDFYESSRLADLRYATTGGLERSANGTSNGARVLSREFYGGGGGSTQTSCLRTYLQDGVTEDAALYPDDCHYDPRYTNWYAAARNNFDSGANNTVIVDTLYTIGATGRLGMGVATKCDTGSFSGAWSAEFVLDSVRSRT